MIRFVIWATMKDKLGWRPSEVFVTRKDDYYRWERMKAEYEKDYSLEAAFKEGQKNGVDHNDQ